MGQVIIVRFSDDGVLLEYLPSNREKKYKSKDKYFKKLKKDIERGIIVFGTDDKNIVYTNLDTGEKHTVYTSLLSDVEKSIFNNLILYSNSRSISEKRDSYAKCENPNKRFLETFIKNFLKIFPFTPPFDSVSTPFFALCFLIWYSIGILLCSKPGALDLFNKIFVLGGPISLTLGISTVVSYVKANSEISNLKYSLSIEDFNKFNKKKNKRKLKSKEEKELERSKELLSRVQNENIPSMEEEIVNELDKVYKLICQIEDTGIKQELFKRLLECINDYKGKDVVSAGVDTNLEVVLRQSNTASLFVSLQNFKREVSGYVKQNIVDSKVDELRSILSEEVCDDIVDQVSVDLQDGGMAKL